MATESISKLSPIGASVEEISATPFWKALPAATKKILTLFFEDKDHSLPNAVTSYHGAGMRREQAEAVAENLLSDRNVREVIAMRNFGQKTQ